MGFYIRAAVIPALLLLLFSAANPLQARQPRTRNADLVSSSGLYHTLVPPQADKRVLVPRDSVDVNWLSDPAYPDSGWLLCQGLPGGVGFDRDGNYQVYISLDMSGRMRNTSCYFRIPFWVEADTLKEFDVLFLRMRFDDGFAAYLNGRLVASANAILPVHWRSGAVQPHEASSTATFEISRHLDALLPGENLLAIHGLNVSFDSPDFLILPELIARKNYLDHFRSRLPLLILDEALPEEGDEPAAAELGIIDNGEGGFNRLADSRNGFSGGIMIERRETSAYAYPKGRYFFSVVDDGGENQKAGLLDLPIGDEWFLTAPYSDKTLLRTALMSEFARRMGLPATHFRFCQLFSAGDYRGLYLLQERGNRHPNRLAVSEWSTQDRSGGYILKIGRQEGAGFFSTGESMTSIFYQYLYPDVAVLDAQGRSTIEGVISDFERALRPPVSSAQYEAVLDISSFVDYFILAELSKAERAYRSEVLIYKDRDSIDPRLHLTSVWEYDAAFGNIDDENAEKIEGWHLRSVTDIENGPDMPEWWSPLFEDSLFRTRVRQRWIGLRSDWLNEDGVFELLDSLYYELKDGRTLNFERWPVIGVKIEPNGYVASSYGDEYEYLLDWLLNRMDWLEDEIATFETRIEPVRANPGRIGFDLLQNHPNPFNPVTCIRFDLDRPCRVILEVYNLTGEKIVELFNSNCSPGAHTIQWNGCDAEGRALSSGLYWLRARAGTRTQIRKMTLIR